MERSPLEPRMLASAGYEPSSRRLELQFTNGRIYRYLAVLDRRFAGWRRARSKGAFTARTIQPRYAYRDVTPPPASAQRDRGEALRAALADSERGQR